MFPEWGFVDTLAQYSSVNHESGVIAWGANPYAAMPSLHAMDAFIVGVVMFGLLRSRLAKALWLAWPVWVSFAVISTGNHYWLESSPGSCSRSPQDSRFAMPSVRRHLRRA